MSTLQIVPGHVQNFGIRDMSIPTYNPEMATFALHAPVIHLITPKGRLAKDHGTQWIRTADFVGLFGDISKPNTPYYGPASKLIEALAAAGQSSIGIRSLSANKEVARIQLVAVVTMDPDVPIYKRDFSGQYLRDPDGDKVQDGVKTVQGARVSIVPELVEMGSRPGQLEFEQTIGDGGLNDDGLPMEGGGPTIYKFPLVEFIGGVGDYYNACGMNLGVKQGSLNRKATAAFVEATGIYPFSFRMFEDLASGFRNYVKTVAGAESSDLTLFETTYNNVRYSPVDAVGAYTNGNINRQVAIRSCPINDVVVYKEHIESLCQLLWGLENQVIDKRLLSFEHYPWRQMNPFTCQDHTGAPYHSIIEEEPGLWDTTHAVNCNGGVSRFFTNEGLPLEGAEPPAVNDTFLFMGDVENPFTYREGWITSNKLIEADLKVYVDSLEMEDYIRNRQSVFWDIGYTEEVKEVAMQLLGKRKDIIVVPDGTVWDPSGKMNPVAEVYGRIQSLVSSVRMYPESEEWGTAACRSSINAIEAKIINEATHSYFSGNIDLAYAFALFAGAANGTVTPSASPDHGINRVLRLMHAPNIEFEGSTVAADNFNNGAVTLRPYDVTGAFFRPSLVTVYQTSADSVLKDLVTNFLCVCMEKIAQDQWNLVVGDTSISAENYAAETKDRIERKCRDALGGIPKQINAECWYNEAQPGGRAVMNARIHAWFNKGKYMMNLDLFAYNEEDLTV
ncbi:tail sheath [Shewanella phage FishSpeaker]|nr:tail sheath [Shewanella phage FishSpeaker]